MENKKIFTTNSNLTAHNVDRAHPKCSIKYVDKLTNRFRYKIKYSVEWYRISIRSFQFRLKIIEYFRKDCFSFDAKCFNALGIDSNECMINSGQHQ